MSAIAVLLLLALGLTPVKAGEFEVEPGYISLFNGKDLTGWGYRTNNFDGKTRVTMGDTPPPMHSRGASQGTAPGGAVMDNQEIPEGFYAQNSNFAPP